MNVDSYHSINILLDLDKGLPCTPNWSAAPDFLKIIAEHCLRNRPLTILECSSGLTTLVLSRCCQMNQYGHVFSLENAEEYAVKTRTQLNNFDVAEFSTIIHAPLMNQAINKTGYEWYRLEDCLKNIQNLPVDMLVIDGPPGYIQQYSRYPAIPLLFERLSEKCVIFLDDASRHDEKVIVERWLRQYPALRHEYIDTERGCSILSFSKD